MIKKLKQQNNEFHLHFFQIFVTEEREFFKRLDEWIEDIGQDEQHLNTPIYFILREFFRTQEQYLDYIDRFVGLHGDRYTREEVNSWYRIVVKVFSEVMERFTVPNHKYANKIMKAQQATIDELSTPIISLKIIPRCFLIGDIDTTRGMSLLENTLQKCAEKMSPGFSLTYRAFMQ